MLYGPSFKNKEATHQSQPKRIYVNDLPTQTFLISSKHGSGKMVSSVPTMILLSLQKKSHMISSGKTFYMRSFSFLPRDLRTEA